MRSYMALAGAFVVAATPLNVHALEAPVDAKSVIATYSDIAEAMYKDAVATALELRTAVAALLASPNAKTLSAARTAWKAARVPYQQTEGYRFGNKIVDDFEGNVNSWPLDEGLIDYVDGTSYGTTSDENPLYSANIIASKTLQLGPDKLDASTIDKQLIGKLNGALDVEANVGSGYHAIEFLLWGQDLNGTGPGAGDRPPTDFDLNNCTGGNCERRRAYLEAATDLLIDDLNTMVTAWAKGGAARQELAAKGDAGGLTTILTGLGSLSYGELAGERMKLGVILHDPEEEQDCFSDNTHNSHYFDEVGMLAIWTGAYDSASNNDVSGASLRALVAAKAPDAAKRLDEAFAVALSKLKAIKAKADSGEMAYDQMLAAGNDAGNALVLDAVAALVRQTRAIEGVVAALNLKIEVEGSASLDDPSKVMAQ